jgi:acyl-CoA reductase-like NAD-dependent aldehyde dehydrogenase
MSVYRNLIAGEWVGSVFSENINPSNTSDVVGQYAVASADDVTQAVEAARVAFPAWSRIGILERHRILKKAGEEIAARKDELGALLAREEGKTLPEAVGETVRAAQIFDFYSGEVLRHGGEIVPSIRPNVGIEITREALGVIGIITPWNFPIAIPSWKIAPALCYGNTVVFKPAELTPGCAWAVVDILNRAGLPKGVLNLVMGKGSVVGQAMLDSAAIAGITFTGSVGTGKRVAATSIANNRKFQLEMGGKNPMVILDDTDLDVATLAFGGRTLTRDKPGFYLEPTLFTNANNKMRISREEIFGPVASVIKVKDYEEALAVANDTPFGLSAGIATRSLRLATHFKRNSEAGMVMVNLPTAGVDFHVPFGGRKQSSYGSREQGSYAAEFHTTVKTSYTLA